MGENKIQQFLIPNVSKLPKHQNVDVSHRLKDGSSQNVQTDEFKNLLKSQIETTQKEHGIELSMHAAKRLQEREISIDSGEFLKLKEALTKLKDKGGRDSLVVTNNAAYIVDVQNNKIVTAMDKNNMAENVFTKIDSTVFIN